MWHALATQLSEWLGSPYQICDHQALGGGDYHHCYRINNGLRPLFIKISRHSDGENLTAEADGLAHLARNGLIATPAVIGQGKMDGQPLLALEWLDLQRNADDDCWQQFGRQLAQLHLSSDQAMYGFDDDNYLGLSLQPNRWHKHWYRFFAEQRLGWQLELAAEQGLQFGDIDTLIDCAAALLRHHQPKPALLHGDLWSGNFGFCNQQAVLFDPAVYYGDREVDIAMSRLFGPLPDAFYQGYDAVAALPPDHRDRQPLYQLYYLIHHARVFGGHYVEECRQQLKRLRACAEGAWKG